MACFSRPRNALKLGKVDFATLNGPLQKACQQPQIMLVRYDPNLHATMKRFRQASAEMKAEKKERSMSRINGRVSKT